VTPQVWIDPFPTMALMLIDGRPLHGLSCRLPGFTGIGRRGFLYRQVIDMKQLTAIFSQNTGT